jgi:hypothetical protein
MTETMKNRIMIFGPKADGTYVVEFRTAEGEALAISIPQGAASRFFEHSSIIVLLLFRVALLSS